MEEKKMEQQAAQQPAQTDAAQIERRIQDAVERARAEWERAQAESQRVAAMSQQERAGYEMSRREAELAERERKLVARELKAMAVDKLAERGLPRELAEALPLTDEAECLKGLDNLERVFRMAVQAGVDARLRGAAPAAGMGRSIDQENMTDAEYYRMNTKF